MTDVKLHTAIPAFGFDVPAWIRWPLAVFGIILICFALAIPILAIIAIIAVCNIIIAAMKAIRANIQSR